MRTDLHEDPAVVGIAHLTGLDEDSVVGKLHRFWSIADRQTADGFLPNITAAWIDKRLECEGFADAMAEAKWLLIRADGVEIPNFDHWLSKGAKARLLDTRRKASVRKMSGSQPEKNGSTVQESKEIPPTPKGAGRDSKTFEEFWQAYPRKENKPNALRAWHYLDPNPATVNAIQTSLSRQRVTPKWKREDGRYIPLPANYIRGRRWEDAATPESAPGESPQERSARIHALRAQAEERAREVRESRQSRKEAIGE